MPTVAPLVIGLDTSGIEASLAALFDAVDQRLSYLNQRLSDVGAQLTSIQAALGVVLTQGATMAVDFTQDLEEVRAAIAEDTDVTSSAIGLINALADKVDALAAEVSQEPAVQQALRDAAAAIRGNNSTLANAVSDNTPADNGTPSTPIETPTPDNPDTPAESGDLG